MTQEQLVVHDTAGVCRIMGETTLDGLSGSYYVLTPLYMNDATFYVPKGSQKVRLRPVMSADEANALIGSLPEVAPLSFASPGEQKSSCAAILKSGDSLQLAQLTKTLYQDQLRRSRQNRHTGMADTTALKKAESLLFGELATALDIPYDDVLEYIRKHLENV
jgi:CarD family transcriptional regulator